jgi:hypothetical protein
MEQSVQELIEAAETALVKAYQHYDNIKNFPDILESLNNVKAAIRKVKETQL